MTTEEENAGLRVENERLRQQVQDLLGAVAEHEAALKAALERIEELEKGKKGPPSWVKANRPKAEGEKEPRRKREAKGNKARRREEPTRVVEHRLERCPDCGGRLHRKKDGHSHQIIDIPLPAPVEVTEHRVIKGWCAHCEQWKAPQLDLRAEVLGQGRIGLRLTSMIVYLRTAMRLPFRQIQAYMRVQHQVEVSVGELVELLHRVRQASAEELEVLQAAMQASPVAYADETIWREDGQNGYVWSVNVPGPQAIRLYYYHHSRSRWVIKGILGNMFRGVLNSDFLGSYNIYAGPHQRCWVHLLRDLHALKEDHPDDVAVVAWAKAVRELYDEAQAFVNTTSPPTAPERRTRYDTLVERLEPLGQMYARSKGHPCRALAQRLLRHLDEMFQFVLRERVNADNNEAERSLRHLVIARKISGGTRSPAGSATRMTLESLVATWLARGQNPFNECLALLRQIPLPQV
jgi:transposase